jgi:Flp pilus assembly protein TadG
MRNRQSGTAAVELVLALPILLLLTMLTTEFGRAFYEYNTLVKAARAGVRYLSMQTPGTHTAEARNIIVYGNTAGSGSTMLPRLTTARVAAPVWATTGANPLINTVTVRISGYTYQPLVGSVFGVSLGLNALTFGDITATMRSPL